MISFTGLPLLQFQALWVVRVIGEAISIEANQTFSLHKRVKVSKLNVFQHHVVWLFIDDPAPILHGEAAGLVLKVVKLEVRTFMENVDSFSIYIYDEKQS